MDGWMDGWMDGFSSVVLLQPLTFLPEFFVSDISSIVVFCARHGRQRRTVSLNALPVDNIVTFMVVAGFHVYLWHVWVG